jgi:hypothetical protein
MKESAVFRCLDELAQHLDIEVSEVNLRKYSYNMKSGLCKVNGRYRIIIDKHLHLSEKIDVLIDALQQFDTSAFSLPAEVTKLLNKKHAHAAHQKQPDNIPAHS